ncbi:hypothetical protein SZ64_04330 [Erythrobacter sp. SG61-1L]|nr:hypothetical protein SZ64_04330 [Erythrobacter sp. SG61-1L]
MGASAARKGKITLASIVGAAVAVALGIAVPQEESGRKVDATVADSGELQIRHLSGKQYLKVYLDMVGVPTACDGITTWRGKPLLQGKTFTEAECSAMLEEELVKHASAVMACTPGLALSDSPVAERQRQGPRFAAVSLAYNVGTSGYCKSTARARFNAGDLSGGCAAITWWNKAGGRVVKGLVARRAREAKVCREGLGVL